jgi:hypothetical protein
MPLIFWHKHGLANDMSEPRKDTRKRLYQVSSEINCKCV